MFNGIKEIFSAKNTWITGNYPERGIEFRTYMLFLLAAIFMNLLGLLSDFTLGNYSKFSLMVKITITALLAFNFVWSRFADSWRWTNFITVLIIPFFFLPGGWLTNGGMIGGFQYYPVIMAMIITAISRGWFRSVMLLIHFMVLFILVYSPEFRNGFDGWANPESLIPDIAMKRRVIHLFINMIMTSVLFGIYVQKIRHQTWLIQENSAKLAVLSTTDRLTQTSNHRHIMEELDSEVARSARYGSELSVLLIDVGFGKLRDTNTFFSCKDIILKDIGRTLKANLRNTDKAGRYGAEEFIVILPEQSLAKAVIVAEKLQSVIEKMENTQCEWKGVSISIGVAQWKKDEPPAFLLSRVNSAMIKARESGRNCVITSND
ncbi:MAG TPA: GGDEF domain-containing protein [bacterium]|nr:GGDEF domain-containing protein [bacterium]